MTRMGRILEVLPDGYCALAAGKKDLPVLIKTRLKVTAIHLRDRARHRVGTKDQHCPAMVRQAIFVLAVLILVAICHSADNDERSIDSYSKRKMSALWFGPRLGRKKRNPSSDELLKNTNLDREQLVALLEMLQESPWAVVALNEGKRHNKMNFTPRLGRESGEDLAGSTNPNVGANRWIQDTEINGDLMSQRSPPFAPRLGRRVVPFSPRLGRENDRLF
ncbi:PREDICTED: PBAN-type neuropeptides-like [Nicrophorus vespilloides]|uniref:PBAN-type neuropeptides-like n=1 Tax=Nicrophorus vespilloides TaxID=110193 RepID=A0ABM1NGV8_NICVS|nr:PREDICTED: PBAN-type neuropeptides-like [Nicrophorus vespilloides]